jgi:hypothetical protein
MEELVVGKLQSSREKDARGRAILVSLTKFIRPAWLREVVPAMLRGRRMLLVDDSGKAGK